MGFMDSTLYPQYDACMILSQDCDSTHLQISSIGEVGEFIEGNGNMKNAVLYGRNMDDLGNSYKLNNYDLTFEFKIVREADITIGSET